MLGGNEAQKQEYLPKVVDGSEILTLAVDEQPIHAPTRISLSAESKGDGFVLNGAKTFVPEGMSATTYILGARTSGASGDEAGISLFLVERAPDSIHYVAIVRGFLKFCLKFIILSGQ